MERVKDGTGDKIGLSIQFLSQFVAGFVVGFVRGWKLTLVMMSLTPVLAIFAGILGKVKVDGTIFEISLILFFFKQEKSGYSIL